MEGRRLSLREQRILVQIERELARDRRLDEQLRNLRLPRRNRLLAAQRRLRAAELSLLIPTALLLLLAAVRTAALGLLIACCAVGVVTVALLVDALRERAERRRRARAVQTGSPWLASPEQ